MDPAKRLFAICESNAVDLNEVENLLEDFYPIAVASRDFKINLVLHAAARSSARGADLILWFTWRQDKWKPMFTDPGYHDHAARQVWQVLGDVHPEQVGKREEPDTRSIRHEIYLACAPPHLVGMYVRQLDDLEEDIRPVLSQAVLSSIFDQYPELVDLRMVQSNVHCVLPKASRILAAIWRSAKLRHMLLDQVYYLERVNREWGHRMHASDLTFRASLIASIKTV